jgi:hypothetical protein
MLIKLIVPAAGSLGRTCSRMRAILASRPPNRPVAGPLDSSFSRRSSWAEAVLSVPSRLTVVAAAAMAAARWSSSSSDESSSDEEEPASCFVGRAGGQG